MLVCSVKPHFAERLSENGVPQNRKACIVANGTIASIEWKVCRWSLRHLHCLQTKLLIIEAVAGNAFHLGDVSVVHAAFGGHEVLKCDDSRLARCLGNGDGVKKGT